MFNSDGDCALVEAFKNTVSPTCGRPRHSAGATSVYTEKIVIFSTRGNNAGCRLLIVNQTDVNKKKSLK